MNSGIEIKKLVRFFDILASKHVNQLTYLVRIERHAFPTDTWWCHSDSLDRIESKAASLLVRPVIDYRFRF